MGDIAIAASLLETLRVLSASDPKQARDEFRTILARGGETLDDVLRLASSPGDSRLRHVIANVFKADAKASVLESWLRLWQGVETDEFTKTAIQSALAARAPRRAQKAVSRSQPTNMLDAYRFVSDRLCHRVRNAMTLPNANIARLEYAIANVQDSELKNELLSVLAGMKTGFMRIARTVEFDTGDDYLTWQNIPLVAWMTSMESALAAKFGDARLIVTGDESVRRAKVRATKFLLETIIGNLWSNAIQASESTAILELECALDAGSQIRMVILDNGTGFAERDVETAFRHTYSSKSQLRGRGLMEIADAVARLQGSVGLERRLSGDLRAQLMLPTVAL